MPPSNSSVELDSVDLTPLSTSPVPGGQQSTDAGSSSTHDVAAGTGVQQPHTQSPTASSGSSLIDGSNSPASKWYWKLAKLALEELSSITRLQWLLMMVVAVVMLPWAYRSYRLAQWTAKLEYLQECRETLAVLTGKAKTQCELAIRKGIGTPPGFDLPHRNQTLDAMIRKITPILPDDPIYQGAADIPAYLYAVLVVVSSLIAGVVTVNERWKIRSESGLLADTIIAKPRNRAKPLLYIAIALSTAAMDYQVLIPYLSQHGWTGFAAFYESCELAHDQQTQLSDSCSRLVSRPVLLPPALPVVKLPDLVSPTGSLASNFTMMTTTLRSDTIATDTHSVTATITSSLNESIPLATTAEPPNSGSESAQMLYNQTISVPQEYWRAHDGPNDSSETDHMLIFGKRSKLVVYLALILGVVLLAFCYAEESSPSRH